MKKITVEDWLAAEETLRGANLPQPEGSVTVEQYAEMRKLSVSRAQTILYSLVRAGQVKSERWINGKNGCRKVYWLIKIVIIAFILNGCVIGRLDSDHLRIITLHELDQRNIPPCDLDGYKPFPCP